MPSSLGSEEHTSELQSPCNLVCRLLLEKKRVRHHLELVAGFGQRINTQHFHRGGGPARAELPAALVLLGANLAENCSAYFFFFNNAAPPEIYPLPHRAAFPI